MRIEEIMRQVKELDDNDLRLLRIEIIALEIEKASEWADSAIDDTTLKMQKKHHIIEDIKI